MCQDFIYPAVAAIRDGKLYTEVQLKETPIFSDPTLTSAPPQSPHPYTVSPVSHPEGFKRTHSRQTEGLVSGCWTGLQTHGLA